MSGTRFVGDWRLHHAGPAAELYLGHLPACRGAALRVRYLLRPQSSYGRCQSTHPHPFLSPDSKRAFFNSDLGQRHAQIFMIENLPDLEP